MKKHNSIQPLEQDIIYFLEMCTDDDKDLFIAKDKNTEDFVRFICLGLAFNLRGVFLSVFTQYEEVGDIYELLNYMDTVTYELAEKWITEFLGKIKHHRLKECAQSFWDEKKAYFTNNKFALSKMMRI